jgi:hypothetical protein
MEIATRNNSNNNPVVNWFFQESETPEPDRRNR